MKKLIVMLLMFCMVGVYAQEIPPIMIIRPEPSQPKKLEKLKISSYKVNVKIHGYIAETEMTMTFFNPNQRAMEGDLYFPLPEGATISGYALDIKGQMVDGVVVEKAKGRQVFDKIVRQGIDPGLVEWTTGNTFKTRVFPIPANGSRTVRVKYVSDIVNSSYRLPLNFKNKISDSTIRIEVLKPQSQPVIQEGGPEGLKFKKWQDCFIAEKKINEALLDKDIVVKLPDVEKQTVIVEKSSDGEFYFCINDFPKTPDLGRASQPERICILWDASGSREKADHKREIGLLKKYFANFANLKVDIVVFRNDISSEKSFNVSGGNVDEILAFLDKIQYDGGTQIGSISPDEIKTEIPDFYMLFSDGISNFGKEEPKGFKKPVYAFSTSKSINPAFLKYLASSTGGDYFNLIKLKDESVVSKIGTDSFRYLSSTYNGKEITGVYPDTPQTINGRFTITGKLLADKAEITINYGVNGNVMGQKSFTVQKGEAIAENLLRYYWAQEKLESLLLLPEKNKEEITQLGKKYSIVTPGTSLIVLESLQQYVEHKIAPPESLPKMRKEYFAKIATSDEQIKKKKEDKLSYVLALWQKRVKWWEKEFKYPKDFKVNPKKEKNGRTEREDLLMTTDSAPGGPGGRDTDGVEPPPPPPEAIESDGEAFYLTDSATRAAPEREVRGRPPFRMGQADGLPIRKRQEDGKTPEASIAIKPWNPKTPYIKKIKAAGKEEQYNAYIQERKEFGASPSFFLDCSDFFRKNKQKKIALRILSNIAEMELENPQLLRVLAHKLDQIGETDLSIQIFEKVLDMRPEDPQSFRDLALVLVKRAEKNSETTKEDYSRAIELLYKVVMGKWDRFAEIEAIALMEINRLIPKARKAGVEAIPVDPRLIKLLDVDVRIIMTWDADLTDMDLWVIEPSGEKAFYRHPRTVIGGHMSKDFTQGYGPEEYILKKTMKGDYKIKTNYYGSSSAKLIGAVTLQVDIFTNYGRENEKHQAITIRLEKSKEVVDVGTIKF